MKVFRNRAEAEKAGFLNFGRAPDHSLLFMHRKTAERATVRTDLEAQLAEALADLEWSGRDNGDNAQCPTCARQKKHDSASLRLNEIVGIHTPDCKLSLALKSFRGDPT